MSGNESVFDKRIAIVLVIALIVNSVYAGIGHLILMNFLVHEWLVMNICVPISASACLGLINYSYKPSNIVRYYSIAVTVLLFRFGGGGFIYSAQVFGWTLVALQSQIAHGFMVATGIYILYFVYKDENGDLKSILLKGALPGIAAWLIIELVLFPLFFSANPFIYFKYYMH